MLLRVFTACLTISFVTCKGDAYLKLESRPGIIHPMLTKRVQLRCSVQNSLWRSQGKCRTITYQTETSQLLWNDTTDIEDKIESKSSLSEDKVQVSQLLSLVVTKMDKETGLNDTIASVTGCNSAVIDKKFIGSVHVKGSSGGSPNHGEQRYILLTWDRPTDDLAGYFVCEAFGLNSDKHSVSLVASLEITAAEPTISDLVQHISLNDRYIDDLKIKVSELNKENEQLRHQTGLLEQSYQNIHKAMDGFNNVTFQIQSGRILCGQQVVSFSPAFSSPPKVFTSPSSLSGNLRAMKYVSISYSMSISTLTRTYFTILCDMGQLSKLTIDWIAVGE